MTSRSDNVMLATEGDHDDQEVPNRLSILQLTVRAGRRFKPGIQRSILLPLLFGLPFWLWYFFLYWYTSEPYISYDIILVVLWVSLSPMLLTAADDALRSFLQQVRPVMVQSDWQEFKTISFSLFYSNRFFIFTPFLSLGMAAAGWFYGKTADFNNQATIFLIATLFIAGFMASMGFWGVFVISRVVHQFSESQVEIDPGHIDKYGGLSHIGRFLTNGILLFFSGSLLIPFAITLVLLVPGMAGTILSYALIAFFFGFGLINFINSIFLIHDKVFQEKLKLVSESQETLKNLLQEHVIAPEADSQPNNVLRPFVYYEVYHKQIAEMKEYPYDFRTLLELAISILIPIVILLLDRYLRN